MPFSWGQVLCWDLEHTGCHRGDTYLDVDIFELGGYLLRWEGGELTPVQHGRFDSLVHCTKPMTPWVREHIAMDRPGPQSATPDRLLAARALPEVLAQWVERVQGCKRDATEAVVLAGHNAFSVDWRIMYWCMVKARMDAHGTLVGLGVVGVLDTLLLAKHLPEAEQQKLSMTDAGNRSYANKSLVKGLLGWDEASLVWHQAVDDARGTAEVLRTAAMRALLPRAHLEMKALIKLDQLVLAVHHMHNERVRKTAPDGPPAGKKRKASVCSYCNGTVQPAYSTRRTCPKFIADEAAKAAAAAASPASAARAGPSGSQ